MLSDEQPRCRPQSKPRRTNAERTATAGRKLLEAALKTLCEAGYEHKLVRQLMSDQQAAGARAAKLNEASPSESLRRGTAKQAYAAGGFDAETDPRSHHPAE